jgi:hypothetical protein
MLKTKQPSKPTTWQAQEGSQRIFMESMVYETLYEGTRGPGKTDALLMSFTQFVGRGFAEDWRGVIFRQTYKQLTDLVAKSRKWFNKIDWGTSCTFNEQAMTWTWGTGEQLLFRYMRVENDYDNYHGHAYPFIGWEELTNWADDSCYKKMFSCCRSTNPRVPRMVRATCNPSGVGHNWVKHRFQLPGSRFKTLTNLKDEDGHDEHDRLSIYGTIDENVLLLTADPDYKTTISASANSEAQRRAWLYGDWDIVSGGMFDDIWYNAKKYIVVNPFNIPKGWKMDRSFDWGSTKPFSVGWWAESDGSDVKLEDGSWKSTVRGDLFRIHEYYGCGAKVNSGLKYEAKQISEEILIQELERGWENRVRPGPADSSIFTEEDGPSVATNMAKSVRVDGKLRRGIRWLRADKRPGSRIAGWSEMRSRFSNTIPPESGVRELPGLYFFSNCVHSLRTVPALPRDEKNLDDVDTDAEDHIADEIRYRVRHLPKKAGSGRVKGMV